MANSRNGEGALIMAFDDVRRRGRAPGSRNRFSQRVLNDAIANWEKHGTAAMEDMRAEDPGGYVRAMFSILPKELTIEAVSSGLSAEERGELIEKLKQHLLTRPQEPILLEAKAIEAKTTNGNGFKQPDPTRARED
jgi:hypothetical protein